VIDNTIAELAAIEKNNYVLPWFCIHGNTNSRCLW